MEISGISVALGVVLVTLGYFAYRFFQIKRRIEKSIRDEEERERNFNPEKAYRDHLRKKAEEMTDVDFEEKLGYNPTSCETTRKFKPISSQTHCVFAKTAKVWGAKDYDDAMSLEENVKANLEALELFTEVCPGLHLDGFLFEIPKEFNDDLEAFSQAVRRVLTVINAPCATRSYIDKPGWFFEFSDQSFFITTFSTCYPTANPRYCFGASCGFVLLQPEISFFWRDIGNDTPHTNWDAPKTVRDKIRIEYKKHGRPYHIPETLKYSPAIDLVKPMKDGDPIVAWWKKPKN